MGERTGGELVTDRSGELIIPTENTVLEEGDVLLVAVKTKDLPSVADLITGK